ncbi:type IV pilus modification protein PilV [Ideonella livida]|uniref:Type IV pilus modification protein PilV n=1 Tax=Ideonella livida TaxID=2707176 RepID=A0A7C9TLY2_9BURK|nr:type IV pilus modification protein PilV [Ideonella livida]NDY93641.1 type IV pilus modification protein PilV [Ideonella livida]
MHAATRHTRPQAGFTLVEVLVTLLLLSLGLLGLAGMQGRMNTVELESQQRSQALLLLQDMASRMAANRGSTALDAYADGAALDTPQGVGRDCESLTASSTRVDRDLRAWCLALQGAAEQLSVGGNAVAQGGLIGGRGCVEALGNSRYLVTVAWQGMTPLNAPVSGLACGQGEYDGSQEGSTCTDDRCRRVVSTIVRVGAL